jgi:hypothetical protein
MGFLFYTELQHPRGIEIMNLLPVSAAKQPANTNFVVILPDLSSSSGFPPFARRFLVH